MTPKEKAIQLLNLEKAKEEVNFKIAYNKKLISGNEKSEDLIYWESVMVELIVIEKYLKSPQP